MNYKFSSKALAGAVLLILAVIAAPAFIQAQTVEISGLSVAPALADIDAGSNYDLRISNNTSQSQTVELEVALFAIDATRKRISPVSAVELLKPEDYLSPSSKVVTVPANGVSTVNIRYIAEPPGYLAGVYVRQNGEAAGIALSGQLASVVVTSALSETDLKQISTSITVTPELGLAGINLGNKLNLETKVTNSSGRILRPGGNIKIKTESQVIQTISLTGVLENPLYPKSEGEIHKEFIDPRPFWQRIGTITAEQTILLQTSKGQRSIPSTTTIFNFPWEMAVISALAMLIFIAILILRSKRRKLAIVNKPATNLAKL